jgi:hypothetical protein
MSLYDAEMPSKRMRLQSMMYAYTTRWTKDEMDDMKRISADQGIPVSRLIRLGLLHYYVANDEMEAFKDVRGVDRLAKNKILEDSGRRSNSV